MRRGAGGLMDKTDPAVEARLCAVASEVCARLGISFHQMRHRNLGNAWWVELHLLMSGKTSVETGHAWATEVEDALEAALPGRAFVTTHIEPIEAHDAAHKGTHFPHKA
jgi:divalent metal cation (Fe/Co/Zn/Cd) transporter